MVYRSGAFFASLLVASSLSTVIARDVVELNFDGDQVVPAPPGYEEYTSPLVLPSPNATGADGWGAALAKAQAFVAQLTLEELVNMTTGAGITTRCVGNTGTIPRLGFEGFCLEDSPLGVRFADFVSAFPAGINVATTWDKDMMYARGEAMGAEFRGKGVNVALGPMMNMLRAPEAGRNWEGFGGEPFLTGVGAALTVKGIQSKGVMACAKHFIGNEQEHYRGGSGATAESSNIDDRTMHEIYSWPFGESVKAGVVSVMASYNRVNQTFASENSKLLNGLLKEEFDFQGFVVSDWGALESGVDSALNGMDMNMPGFKAYGDIDEKNPAIANDSYWGAALVESVKNGSVPLWRVQDMVTRSMSAYYKLGQDSGYPAVNFDQAHNTTYYDGKLVNEHINVQGDHATLIRAIGAASTVLLKNTDNILPLKTTCNHWGIFGTDADVNPDGANACPDRGCDKGTLAMGWGSGTDNFPYLVSPALAIQKYVQNQNDEVSFTVILNDTDYSTISQVASKSDVCLVFANADSGEGYITVQGNAGDRNDLYLWNNGTELIKTVAKNCESTIAVIHSVGPVDMEEFVEMDNIKAILWAGLPGQESGNALVDVLFGDVNPSGRLPYTIGKNRTDYPADVLYISNMTVPQITYSENLLLDYRWFEAKNITPRYEFGYGMSYTTFYYSDISVECASSSSNQRRRTLAPRWSSSESLYDPAYTVSFDVKNTGDVCGHEVAQLYLGFPETAGEPPKILRGFEKVYLKPDCSQTVNISLRRKDISIWNVVTQRWEIPSGTFKVYVGQSSSNIKLYSSFEY